MQTAREPVFSASLPPLILDTDMSGRVDSDPDFEFFDSNNPDAGNSPGIFMAEDFATDSPQFPGFGSPDTAKSPLQERANLLDTKLQQSLSAPSTASPAGSYPDSASDSSGYKRKSSTDSSRSAGDVMMADDTDMGDWKVDDMMTTEAHSYSGFDGTINPSAMDANFGFNDKSMENDFDFESAASSPSPFGIGPVEMDSPEMPTIKYDTPKGKHSPMLRTKFNNHNKANSVGSHPSLQKRWKLISIATFCDPIYEWTHNVRLEREFSSLCNGDESRIFSFCVLQSVAISWHWYRFCQWDDGWWSSSIELWMGHKFRVSTSWITSSSSEPS